MTETLSLFPRTLGGPLGLRYQADFVSAEEERELVAHVRQSPLHTGGGSSAFFDHIPIHASARLFVALSLQPQPSLHKLVQTLGHGCEVEIAVDHDPVLIGSPYDSASKPHILDDRQQVAFGYGLHVALSHMSGPSTREGRFGSIK
jgi:hypothetical protein